MAHEDFTELAALAHWLKGAGGNVGFAVFGEEAMRLEQAAKAHLAAETQHSLAEIDRLRCRIELPLAAFPSGSEALVRIGD